MLDMFRRVLPAIDTRNKKFYEGLSDEERKGFGPWLVQRYLSSAESPNAEIIEHYLIMTNEIVNVKDIKDPEILYKLMSIVGIGKSIKHPYVAPGKSKKKKVNPIKDFLQSKRPDLNSQEIDILFSQLTKQTAINMLEQYHIKDKTLLAAANDL